MKVVDYLCENCGFAKVPSRKKYFFVLCFRLLVTLFAVLGLFFLFLFLFIGPDSFTGLLSTGLIEREAEGFVFDYRGLALNLTGGYDCGDWGMCYANALFHELKSVGYVPNGYGFGGLYPPLMVLDGGDCKNLSYLYVFLARSVGVDARIVCSVSQNHCVSLVLSDDRRFVVDLTIPNVFELESGMSVWDYQEGIVVG